MLDIIKNKIENLEMIAANFVSTPSKMTFTKEKLTDLLTENQTKLPLEFDFLLVAISNNGGLIAICKKMNYYDQNKTRINDNLLVMHQNADKRYYIPLDWEYSKRYIVSLGFNDKEQLYAFCNDGTLLKIDTLINKAVVKLNSQIFLDEGISKAKLFENGFIALTNQGNIFLVKDIKNPMPIFMINIKEQLSFSDKVDFIGIPTDKSKSHKFELLLINEKGNGILHIEQQDSVDQSFDKNIKHKNVPISLINSDKIEDYNNNINNNNISTNNNTNNNDWENIDAQAITKQQHDSFGKINAMAISPSKKEIALYSANNKTVYIIPSNLNNLVGIEKYKYEISSDLDIDEVQEHKALLAFDPKYEFMFCTDDAMAICGQRFIIIINKKNETLSFKMIEGSKFDAISGVTLFKCIPEVDGIRCFTKEGIFLISKVSKELYDTCQPFSTSPAKKLIKAYGTYLSKNADCDKQIREIVSDLPEAIKAVQTAAVNIYWTNNIEGMINKELQMLLFKAAQYGKSFVQKGDFNYDKFVEKCNSIRIINYLRNYENKPRYLTFEEYQSMDPSIPDSLIKKILRHHNYELAYNICNFLNYETETVYHRFITDNIKKIDEVLVDVNKLFEELESKCSECPNISYITLAKKCIKYDKKKFAEKFLEKEKSIVVKVPQYLQLKNWSKALELSLESHDRTVIKVVIDKIFKVEEPNTFIKIVGAHPKAHTAVIEYLRLQDKETELKTYLNSQKDQEELFYMSLEKFFRCKTIQDRKDNLKIAKVYLDQLKGNPNIDFYKAYLKDITNSLKFKKECIDNERGIIPSNDISLFDNSIFECYKLGVGKNYNWIEKQNKEFEIGQKKLSYIRFKYLANEKNLKEMDDIVKKIGYKKLDISPLEIAQILYGAKLYDHAVQYIKEITDQNDFDEKINLLKKMQRYDDALEIAISDKKTDKQIAAINDILRIRPDLKNKASELCMKNKINLG